MTLLFLLLGRRNRSSVWIPNKLEDLIGIETRRVVLLDVLHSLEILLTLAEGELQTHIITASLGLLLLRFLS